jgi:hypothetical protein
MRNTRLSTGLESRSRSRRNVPRGGTADTNGLHVKRRSQSSTKKETTKPETKARNLRKKSPAKCSLKIESKKSPTLRGKRGAAKHASSEEDSDDDVPKKKNKKGINCT